MWATHRVARKVCDRFVRLRSGKYAGVQRSTLQREALRGRGDPDFASQCAPHAARRRDRLTAQVRRARKHRQRREHKVQAGLMVLWDGSRHDWLEGRGSTGCLMGAVDDAPSSDNPARLAAGQRSRSAITVIAPAKSRTAADRTFSARATWTWCG